MNRVRLVLLLRRLHKAKRLKHMMPLRLRGRHYLSPWRRWQSQRMKKERVRQ